MTAHPIGDEVDAWGSEEGVLVERATVPRMRSAPPLEREAAHHARPRLVAASPDRHRSLARPSPERAHRVSTIRPYRPSVAPERPDRTCRDRHVRANMPVVVFWA